MKDPTGQQRVVHPPLVRAGLAALAVPAVLGMLAVPGLLLEAPSWPLVVLTIVGFPLVLLAGEDALAVGVVATTAAWVPIVGTIWWTVGRRVASGTVRDPAGFTWASWARKFARVAPLVLLAQTLTALAAPVVIPAVAIVLLLHRYSPTPSASRQQPAAADGAYGQHKQCPRCGEFIELGSTQCGWCDERLARKWHRSMP